MKFEHFKDIRVADLIAEPRWPRRLLRSWAILLAILGAPLLIGGSRLVVLGGSPYYVIAGAMLIATAVLLWRLKRWGARLYAVLTIGTILWACAESGFYGWALAPRILPFLVMGVPLLLPPVRRLLTPPSSTALRRSPLAWVLALLLVVVSLGIGLHSPYAVLPFPTAATTAVDGTGDWTHYGRTAAGTRYAPFSQINRGNVSRLRVAWAHRTGVQGSSQATPLQIGDALYSCSGGGVVQALDIDTGKARWQFDPVLINRRVGRMEFCRGVSYHEAPDAQECPRRILWGTMDARLFAIDAATGQRCASFGRNGEVDLLEGLGAVEDGEYWVNSPPMILRGLAVIGGSVFDGKRVGAPSGVVRAFDVRTGKLRWAWDPARPEPITELPPGEVFTPGTPNAWSVLSADDALGLVYVPMGGATPDFVGERRSPAAEQYGSAVIALDIETGKVRWSFQTTHHDVWDYDVPAQPVLVDFNGSGGTQVPALIVPTKRGELFVLDRQTGRPLATVEERPVPQTTAPGEWTAKTQPFSTGMPAFGRSLLTEEQMWGITPIDQMMCRIAYRELRYEGAFTPPSLQGSLQWPGYAGGINWGSVAVDEAHQVMIVNFLNVANTVALIPRKQFAGGFSAIFFPQLGTDFAAKVMPFLSPLFTPCQQPPYGELAAVDLRSRQVLWRKPLGSANELGPLGLKSHLPITMGVINRGGTLVTRGDVVFFGGTMDRQFRAFDLRSGDTLWSATLPRSAHATPMSYVSPRSGRQYVVLTVPGVEPAVFDPHQKPGAGTALVPTDSDASGWVIAYALPASGR